MDDTSIYVPGPKRARVEIIPLIDVVFFLLATFVLFTLSLEKIRVLPVPMPIDGRPSEEDRTVFIQASENGACYWRIGRVAPPEFITREEIRPRLEDYQRQVRDPRVVVRGDRKAKFGPTVGVLDEVRKAGIRQISVETVARPTGG